MPTLDTDLLTEIQAALLEDALFSNGLWSLAEVLRYFNQRQYRFLSETKIQTALGVIPWIPTEPTQPLPPDWIATISALWHDLDSGEYHVLPATDAWEIDHLNAAYATTGGTPQGYRDGDTLETLTLTLGPAPIAQGAVELLYVSLSELLDGTGRLFTIPDDWVPYLKYGVYADMLGKEGRGQDLIRARYSALRYQEGIVLAQSLLAGWT